jgi:hypothetical protein
MKVIENNRFLSKRNKNFIKHIFEDVKFPFYISPSTKSKKNKDGSFVEDRTLCHVLLNRKEYRKKGEYANSIYLNEAIDILNNFTKKTKIKYKEILRAAINFTYNNGYEFSGLHVDHQYDHFQLLVYLNDCDPDSVTILQYKNKNIKIKPKKFKGIVFKKVPHMMKFPQKGERVILIITFR